MKKQIITLIIGAILTTGGGVLAQFIGAPILENAKESESWASVSGVITKSELTSEDVLISSTSNAPRISATRLGVNTGRKKKLFQAHVIYTYEVDGTTYISSNIRTNSGFRSSNSSDAEATVKQYPVGSSVQVFFNPENLNEAVLQRGANFSSYAVYIGGWFVFGLGLLAFIRLGIGVLYLKS